MGNSAEVKEGDQVLRNEGLLVAIRRAGDVFIPRIMENDGKIWDFWEEFFPRAAHKEENEENVTRILNYVDEQMDVNYFADIDTSGNSDSSEGSDTDDVGRRKQLAQKGMALHATGMDSGRESGSGSESESGSGSGSESGFNSLPPTPGQWGDDEASSPFRGKQGG